jgi:micrococcal nuclease
MKKERIIILLLGALLFLINYPFIDSLLIEAFDSGEEGFIERVVDGDTVIINGKSVRLLGINSPERGEPGYLEAKEFMEEFNGSKVYLKFGKNKYDKYYRKLAYVFSSDIHLNLESVKQGYSNYYFPSGKDKYYLDFTSAWQECLNSGCGLCDFVGEECLEFDWQPKEDFLLIRNLCFSEFDLQGYSIKDEGRKKHVFSEKVLRSGEVVILSSSDFGKDYVWTQSGDSIFVRNIEGKLIYFDSY